MFNTLSYYFEQLCCGLWVKAMLASVGVIFVDYFHGNHMVLSFYLFMAGVDLVLAVVYALAHDTFNPKAMLRWVKKLASYILLGTVIGGVGYTWFSLTNQMLYLLNWYIMICILTEFGSIVFNMRNLGMPIHPVILLGLNVLRKKTSRRLSDVLGGDEELAVEIQAILEERGVTIKDGKVIQPVVERRKTPHVELPPELERRKTPTPSSPVQHGVNMNDLDQY